MKLDKKTEDELIQILSDPDKATILAEVLKDPVRILGVVESQLERPNSQEHKQQLLAFKAAVERFAVDRQAVQGVANDE